MKVLDFIICEDIRDELRSKSSIMGIFNDKIKIQAREGLEVKFPINIAALGFYARIVRNSDEAIPATWEAFGFIDDGQIVNYKGSVFAPEEQILTFKVRLPGLPITLGKLKFIIRLFDKEEKPIFEAESYPISILIERI